MSDHQLESGSPIGFTHRLLERLTAVKAHIWMLRQRLRRGAVDPAAAEAHLDQIESQVDEAAALAANLQGQIPPPP